MKGFLLCIGCCALLGLNARQRPNILLIVSEDNGPELGCYGAPVPTPHLDQLAKRGVVFENAYVTQAGCSPSRASFLTGLYPHQNGQIGLATWKYELFNPKTPNIPKSLQEAGYETGIIGKLHINPKAAFPFDFKVLSDANFKRNNLESYTEAAKKFINQSSQPFFLQVNYPDAHAPFLKQVDGVPAQPLLPQDTEALPYMGIQNEQLKTLTANYYNSIMRLDKYVGDLIEVLNKSGKGDNTVVIYMGDHGADMLRGKRTCYEGGVRIPLIVYAQGTAPKRVKDLVSTIDVYPSVLEWAGLKVPAYLPGKSFVALLDGESYIPRRYLFTEFHTHSNNEPYPQRSVRDERYKLIYNPLAGLENPGFAYTLNHTVKLSEAVLFKNLAPAARQAYQLMKNPPEYELYDLWQDPYEWSNIADQSKYEPVLKRLQAALKNWQQQTNDALADKSVARKLFEMIRTEGLEKRERSLLPYKPFMDPHFNF
ncbi:sulfatase [Niabella insulamsoli]|uniref:sulfatase family protein n=1 Tax=Niabella insulamsoli TaxID=3144874 RepID=UPI0031FE11C2